MALNFDEVYARTRQRVWSLCVRLSPDRADAEDALQEIFILVFRYLPGFRGEANVDTWCYRIALNYLMRAQSRLRRERCLPLNHDPVHPETPVAVIPLAEALADLEPDEREVLTLVYFCEQPQSDVAALLGLPLGTLHSRLSRAKTRLKEAMQRHGYRQPNG